MTPNVAVARQVPRDRPLGQRFTVLELVLVCRLTAAELCSHLDFVLSLAFGDFDGLNGRHHYVLSRSSGACELVYF